MTSNTNPSVVVLIKMNDGQGHWVTVDGVTTRTAPNGQSIKVVAVRDSQYGEEYYSPVDTFNEAMTGIVVKPYNPE